MLAPPQSFADTGEELYRGGQYQDAIAWWERAARGGDPDAAYQLGSVYLDGVNVPQNYAEAAEWLKQSANAGNPRAQFDLATLYDLGNGIKQSYAEAVKWYRAAAEQGLAPSQFNLGSMYEQGLGVAIDLVEAYKWFYLAESQGIGFDKFKATERLSAKMTEPEIQEAIDRGEHFAVRSKKVEPNPAANSQSHE